MSRLSTAVLGLRFQIMAGFAAMVMMLWYQGRTANEALHDVGETFQRAGKQLSDGADLQLQAQELRVAVFRVLGRTGSRSRSQSIGPLVVPRMERGSNGNVPVSSSYRITPSE